MAMLNTAVKFFAVLAAIAAIGVPLFFIAAALGTKFGVWDWRFGFGTLTRQWGPNLLFFAVGIGALTLIVAIIDKIAVAADAAGAGVFVAAIAALAVGLGGLGYAANVRAKAQDIPPIHDISTDTEDPPAFSEDMIARRGEGTNPVDYAEKTNPADDRPLAETQAASYPGIAPIELAIPPGDAYAAALETARAMGWRTTIAPPEGDVFEATAETFWFGFKDDVIVRVREGEDGGSVVDVRSVSRVGASDLGANAARIEAFEQRLRDRAQD